MNKKVVGALLGTAFVAALVLGSWYLSGWWGIARHNPKPALQSNNSEIRLDAQTPVILETEYTRSHQVVISQFTDQQDIIGDTIEEIRSRYTTANGYNVSFKDSSLVIHQAVDDWSPADKAICQFKEYRNMVAVYQGPDAHNDILLKVTSIRFDKLPADIQDAILKGQYEFENQAAADDALENLDEYI